MAEAMTVESMIQAYWHMEHYFTIPRFSFLKERIDGSGYSDIDLLAFKTAQWIDPETKTNIDDDRGKTILVLCESKAHGEKNKIKYDDYKKEKFIDFDSLKDEANQHDLIKFYFNVDYIITHGSLNNLINLNNLDILKLQFISTALFCNEDIIVKSIENKIRELFIDKYKFTNPTFLVKLEITTHFDIINKLFAQVQKDETGKRYGNPVLDFVRELNRYINVNKCDGINSIMDISVKANADEKIGKYDLLKLLFKEELNTTFEDENRDFEGVSKRINNSTTKKANL